MKNPKLILDLKSDTGNKSDGDNQICKPRPIHL